MFLKKYPEDFNLRRGLNDDTEKPMPVKEEFYYLHFLRKGNMPHHAGATLESTSFAQEAEERGKPRSETTVVFYVKDKSGQAKQLRAG